jgi:hypothetical protein
VWDGVGLIVVTAAFSCDKAALLKLVESQDARAMRLSLTAKHVPGDRTRDISLGPTVRAKSRVRERGWFVVLALRP